jgi:hypothetical protein
LHDPGQAAALGLPRQMETSTQADDFIPAALAAFGVEADEVELAVMRAAHEMFWPPILELLALDITGVEPERDPDLSQGPDAR